MELAITIVIAIVIFGILIISHEFGHFITAKAVGIKIHEFAIGMGPLIYQKQKGETMYSLRLFPIGGFVSMEGENEESDDEGSFSKKSPLAKILVLIAGSLMNFLTALLLVIILMFSIGSPTNAVGELVPGGSAELAGVSKGDVILAINDVKVDSWTGVTDGITKTTEDTLKFSIKSADTGKIDEKLIPVTLGDDGRRVIGIYPLYVKNPVTAIRNGVVETFNLGAEMIKAVGLLLTGQAPIKDVVGPIGIVSVVQDATQLGFLYVLNLTAIISLNLALINMLPIPALDGGRLLFIIIPLITGKPINPEKENTIHYIGFLILIGLMLLVTFKDINQFIL